MNGRRKEHVMRIRNCTVAISVVLLAAASAIALHPDDELWIPAAARGQGRSGSMWVTDLYVMNLGEDSVTVEITWLARDTDNTDAEGEEFEIEGGSTLVLEDVLLEVFGMSSGGGALQIEAVEEDESGDETATEDGEDEDGGVDGDPMLVAYARVYNLGEGGGTFGQGLEGMISDAAISAEDADSTHSVGVTDDEAFRSNWFGLNITEDEDDEPGEAEVLVELLDVDGTVLAAAEYVMPPLAPMLEPIADLGGPEVANATVRFTMLEGEGVFGVSKADQHSNDPTTLEAHWVCEDDDGQDDFTEEFFIEGCTFATTGETTFFVLEPGVELVLEGDEDGVEIEAIMTVLDQTEMVNGVETRVVEERESEDGELVEVSRNFWAFCVETGSIFYFGEDVDDYEDGEIVGHEGAWRAGEDGAEPGIIIPGTFLIGSRYFQEIAPGVAMDRAEHTAMGLTVETEAGIFEDCAEILDSSPFDPGSEDRKVYCPGIGLVIDEDLELVEYTMP
jgi:hypothetical protein